MKTILITLLTVLNLITAPSFANEQNTRRELVGQAWVYKALIASFPELQESIGGFSYEFEIKNLVCASSLVSKNAVKTECTAEVADKTVTGKQSSDLFLTLLNAGAQLDKTSEPGTTYILAEDLNCGVLEPKSTNASPSTPEYYCSVSN